MEGPMPINKMHVVVVSFQKLLFIGRNSRALAHPSPLPLRVGMVGCVGGYTNLFVKVGAGSKVTKLKALSSL